MSGVWLTTAGLVLCGKVPLRETGEMGSLGGACGGGGGGEKPVAVRMGGGVAIVRMGGDEGGRMW
jgi:hypothetical protein